MLNIDGIHHRSAVIASYLYVFSGARVSIAMTYIRFEWHFIHAFSVFIILKIQLE